MTLSAQVQNRSFVAIEPLASNLRSPTEHMLVHAHVTVTRILAGIITTPDVGIRGGFRDLLELLRSRVDGVRGSRHNRSGKRYQTR
jgi:hypothetical protein